MWLRPYDIVATSPDSGVIEAVPDTVCGVWGMVGLLWQHECDFTNCCYVGRIESGNGWLQHYLTL